MCQGIGWAVRKLKAGGRVSRRGWTGPGQWLMLQSPLFGGKMTLPFVYIRTVRGDLVPWLASQTDLLADDWALVTQDSSGGLLGRPGSVASPPVAPELPPRGEIGKPGYLGGLQSHADAMARDRGADDQ